MAIEALSPVAAQFTTIVAVVPVGTTAYATPVDKLVPDECTVVAVIPRNGRSRHAGR